MQRLLAALKTAFTDNATINAAVTGGLHFMEAQPGTAMPYAVMTPVASPTTSKYGGIAFSEPTIQFTFRQIGANAALQVAETVMGVLDDLSLTLADSKQCFYLRRQGEPLPEPDDPDQDESGNDVYGWIVTYDFATTG